MKRKTKAQKEAEQRAALAQRISDVYSGANGGEWCEDDFATAGTLSTVVPALQSIFGTEGNNYLFGGHCLRYFDTAESATEHLFSSGVRA